MSDVVLVVEKEIEIVQGVGDQVVLVEEAEAIIVEVSQGQKGDPGPPGADGAPGADGSPAPVTILTQAAYDAIPVKDPAILYVIVG